MAAPRPGSDRRPPARRSLARRSGRPRPRTSRRAPRPVARRPRRGRAGRPGGRRRRTGAVRSARVPGYDRLRPVGRLDGRIDLDLGPFACRQGRLDVTAVVGAPRVRAQGHHRRQAYPKPVPARPSRCSVRLHGASDDPVLPAAERGMAGRFIRRRHWACDVDTGRGGRTRPGPSHHPDPPTCRPSGRRRPARPPGHRSGGHRRSSSSSSSLPARTRRRRPPVLLYVLVQTILSTAPTLGARIGRLTRPLPRLVLASCS